MLAIISTVIYDSDVTESGKSNGRNSVGALCCRTTSEIIVINIIIINTQVPAT